MPKMLADGYDTLWLLDALPADPYAPEAMEINAGVNVSLNVAKGTFQLGAGAPTTVSDTPLGEEGDTQVPTAKTYQAAMDLYRFFNSAGQVDVAADVLFQKLKGFGSTAIFAYRAGGKKHIQEAADGDEISIYEYVSGSPGAATERSGYVKRPSQGTVTRAWENVWVGGIAPVTPPVTP